MGSFEEVSWEEVYNGIEGSVEDIVRIVLHAEDSNRREEGNWVEEDVEGVDKEDYQVAWKLIKKYRGRLSLLIYAEEVEG